MMSVTDSIILIIASVGVPMLFVLPYLCIYLGEKIWQNKKLNNKSILKEVEK